MNTNTNCDKCGRAGAKHQINYNAAGFKIYGTWNHTVCNECAYLKPAPEPKAEPAPDTAQTIKVYFTSFDYCATTEFATLKDAIKAASNWGWSCSFIRDGKTIGTWSFFQGFENA